jgi:hypothetical protein
MRFFEVPVAVEIQFVTERQTSKIGSQFLT